MRLANRGHLLLRTPVPVPFGTCICSNVETILSWTCHIYRLSEFWTSLGTSILLSIKCCESFRFFLAVFMEKFPNICYLNFVRRRVGTHTRAVRKIRRQSTCLSKYLTYYEIVLISLIHIHLATCMWNLSQILALLNEILLVFMYWGVQHGALHHFSWRF